MKQQQNSINYAINCIYHSKEYEKSFKKVVYVDYIGYAKSSIILDVNNININTSNINYYAYGNMFDLYNSKIVPLDLDEVCLDNIKAYCDILIKDPIIKDIDIIETSFKHYHVLLGLTKYECITNIIKNYKTICSGFRNISLNRGYAILRTSPKYSSKGQYDYPIYLFGYRKTLETIIYTNFIQEQKTNTSINLRN